MFLKKRNSLIALFVAFLAAVVFALGAVSFVQSNQTAYATATDNETIDFGSDGISFDDKAALDELITLLGGSDYDDLSSKLTDSKTASEFVSAKTVTLGGVAFNIMYVSKADYTANGTTAGDVIVTLWQADTDSGTDYGLQFNPWTERNTDYAYPSSMYGSSLIRSALMDKNDAERKYVKTAGANELTAYNSSDDNYQSLLEARWAPFKDSDGAFNGYLATPANMAWQESQWLSSIDNSYYYPNDAWDASKLSGASWYSTDYDGVNINIGDIKDKFAYSDWKNDRVWLPSLTEIGRAGNAVNASGLWKTSVAQRANTNNNFAWLRSSSNTHPGYVYHISFNGVNMNNSSACNITNCVRPALHLNLKSIDEAATPKPYEVTVGATPTKYLTFKEAWNAAGSAGTATVKMFADAEVSSALEVSADKNITLDLNGKKLTYTGESGSVIKIDGTFTLEDGGTGSHEILSPVTNETVTVSGGLITGGKGTGASGSVLGGAVYVTGTGVFTMNGGTLAGNTASAGGGVYNYGTFIMKGGRITCNMAGDGLGGGVYHNGTFSVSGAPEITGNTANGNADNVTANLKITVAGELTEGAVIGVGSGFVAEGYTQSDKPGKYFIPDDSANDCVYAKDGKVTIGKHAGGTATCANKAVCANCGEEYGEVSAEHGYGEWTVTLEPTCSAKGGKKRVCAVCGHEETAEIDINGNAHAWNEGEITVQPTCTENGVKIYTCLHNADHTKTKIITTPGHEIASIVIVTAPTKTEYTAFEKFDTAGMSVKTHCLRCNADVEEIDVTEDNVVYGEGDEMHVNCDVSISYNSMRVKVDGLNVNPKRVALIWQYAAEVNAAEEEIDWVNCEGGEVNMTYNSTVYDLRNCFRATFTGGDGNVTEVRGTNAQVQVYVKGESYTGIVKNAGSYLFKLNAGHADFTDYEFTNNGATLTVNPYKIELNNVNNFYWRLIRIGEDEANSRLRNGFIYYNESDSADADNYKYFSEGGVNRSEVMYSIVRNRNAEMMIEMYGWESIYGIYEITYDGEISATAKGKYMATATLTLTETGKINYEFIKTGDIDERRNMTVTIGADGNVSITKIWYVAQIDNGLLSQYTDENGNEYGKEWNISGWTYGGYKTQYAPRLEHGDPGTQGGTVEFGADNNLVTFDLIKTDDPQNTVTIAQGFNRSQFNYYINGSMPAGRYTLKVHVSAYTTDKHEHWFVTDNNIHGGDSAGIYYDAFGRDFDFTVSKADFGATNVSDLSGQTYNFTYDGNLHLFKDFALNAAVYSLREGVWAEDAYNAYYGQAQLYYKLERWTAGGFITEEGLDGYQNQSQTPKNAGIYKVYFKVRANNYNDLGGDNYFTVVINKAVVAIPENVTATLNEEFIYTIPDGAKYRVDGHATFTQAGTHKVTLKLNDADNYAWAEGENVNGDKATITVTLTMHEHVYGGWTVDKAAACTEMGSRSKQCEICGVKAEEEIPALGHSFGEWIAEIAATATENGAKGHKDCAVCNKHFDAENNEITDLVIPATGVSIAQVLITVEGGAIDGTEGNSITVNANGEVTVLANETDGKTFKGWSADGGKTILCEDTRYTFTATENLNLVAVYEDNTPVPEQSKGLSGGAIAGISVGAALLILLAAYIAFYFALYRRGVLLKGKVFDVIYAPMTAIFNKKTHE